MMKQREKYSTVMDLLIIVFMAVLFFVILISSGYAEAGPYIDAGALYTDQKFNDSTVAGNSDFRVLLKAEAGYAWDNGFYMSAVHYSNPEAADKGLNMIGGGFRYEW
jgi:hypothetical protein